MKKLFCCVAIVTLLMLTTGTMADAYSGLTVISSPSGYFNINIEDSLIENARIISIKSHEDSGRLITVTEYITSDGLHITDTFNRGVNSRSANGSDYVSRSRDLGTYGRLTVNANFSWYTEQKTIAGISFPVSYVRCDYMNHSHTGKSNLVVVDTMDEDYTANYVAFGTAHAKLTYSMHLSDDPLYYQNGNITITCDDTGSIHDNA